MQRRQGIVTIFSSFLQFEADQFSNWRVDLKLRRSMENALLQVSQNPSENFWVVYWYKIWQTQASILAAAHISAYLQEVCYWVSRKIATNFTGSLSVADRKCDAKEFLGIEQLAIACMISDRGAIAYSSPILQIFLQQ